MKYMLLFGTPSEEEMAHQAALPLEEQMKQLAAVQQWLRDRRATAFARLQPPATATTLHLKDDGSATMTDGPFIEAKESVGGFALIEAEDLDQALRIAKTWPPHGVVEVRPVQEPPQR